MAESSIIIHDKKLDSNFPGCMVVLYSLNISKFSGNDAGNDAAHGAAAHGAAAHGAAAEAKPKEKVWVQ